MKNRRGRSGGSTLIEFTLVGIPLMFVLISTFEMARGMWLYQSIESATTEGTRYASVHGQNCTLPPNTCGVTISQIATVIQTAGAGLPASDVTLTFTPASGSATTCTLADCIANYTTANWPASTANAPGLKIKIASVYRFRSAISMFWPGAGAASGVAGVVNFSASSRVAIQY